MPTWKVGQAESGSKLLAFLKEKLAGEHSLRQIKKALDNHACCVNGVNEKFASAQLGSGDLVDFDSDKLSMPTVDSYEKSRVLFEDDWLLLYDKPAGVTSERLAEILAKVWPRLQLIHRLDKETTGILMLAKQPAALAHLIDQFKQHKVKKEYLALVDGVLDKKAGHIENYLGKKHSYQGQAIWGSVNKAKGLPAVTDWVLEQKGIQASLLKCIPKTGRTHQIRVHLSELGHPILGDYQYGRKFKCPYRPHRCLLHAAKIIFVHPSKGIEISITSKMPQDFEKALHSAMRTNP
jgi:RluA family pseudouridine synthase